MTLRSPKLDDRTFEDLVREATDRVRAKCPQWDDLSPSDPGSVLIDVFAYLTDLMLYRLNRVPEKAYVEFLRLIGVTLEPPWAASVRLRFALESPDGDPVTILQGTRVVGSPPPDGGEAPVFTTAADVVVDSTEGREVLALHCERVDAEVVGRGTGRPGQRLTVRHAPIVRSIGVSTGMPALGGRVRPHDLVVGVEIPASELPDAAEAVRIGDTVFEIWQEVETFAEASPGQGCYVADRASGVITFAPAVQHRDDEHTRVLARVPEPNREVRVWYRHGGGLAGNVGPGTLLRPMTPLPGVRVTNSEAATGGRAAETMDNALRRGPLELHTRARAVTAQDFETLAVRATGGIARSRAFTQAKLWAHATPGTVEVVLVPEATPADPTGPLRIEDLRARQSPEIRTAVHDELDRRRPLGTRCTVSWAKYKAVSVRARVVISPAENEQDLLHHLRERLHATITPVPRSDGRPGWRFGEALRASHVFEIILAEPGVRYADGVRLSVDHVPDREVQSVARDLHQPSTWYAAAGDSLYRTVNDGASWERIRHFPGELCGLVRAHPQQAGTVVVGTWRAPGSAGGLQRRTSIHLSRDAGETWEDKPLFDMPRVRDIAWLRASEPPVMLMATDKGLYEATAAPGATPELVVVDPRDHERGFYAVAVNAGVRELSAVAVAATATGGVFLSRQERATGRSGTFEAIGQQGKDVRVLAFQAVGPRTFLWAGMAAVGLDDGEGCVVCEMRGSDSRPDDWQDRGAGWKGGSCFGLAFHGSDVFAATHRSGILRLDGARSNARWAIPELTNGLPLREADKLFEQVRAVAVGDGARPVVMGGGDQGVYRDVDADGLEPGERFVSVSERTFLEEVTLPPTWLFVSGAHEIEVVSEDEIG